MLSQVERARRDRTIALLRAFAAGKLTNDQFEDSFYSLLDPRPVRKWEDKTLWAVREVVWFVYDDLHEHKLEGKYALTKESKRRFARTILFLKSDHTYEWKAYTFISLSNLLLNIATLGLWSFFKRRQKDEIDWDIWPFRRVEDFERERLRRV